jgi:uncharacterized membrane protein YhaH (DUF805 family)
MSVGSLLFSFRGRVNRMPYWLVSLAMMIAMGAVLAMLAVGGFLESAAPLLILLVPLIWIGTALAVRRLHDRNKSAWWLIIFYVLPGIMESIGRAAGDAEIAFSIASLGLSIWALVELGFLRGTIGPNHYGPDPLAGELAPVSGAAGSKFGGI